MSPPFPLNPSVPDVVGLERCFMKITFLGHAAFFIETAQTSLLIDPFLTGNPKAAASAADFSPEYILLTHGHSDHVGDTLPIARRAGSTVITTFELGQWLGKKGAKVSAQNHGGWHKYPFGDVKFTFAIHSSSMEDERGNPIYLGEPAGIVLVADGYAIYHAGDTALFSDMQLIAEEQPIDVALLPIGEHFVMGPRDAARAVDFLKPKQAVPIHYGTFPVLVGDPKEFARLCEGKPTKINILAPGESITLG